MFISTLALVGGPAAFFGMASAAPLDVRTSYLPDNCCDTDYSLIHPYNNNSLCLTAPYDAYNGLYLTMCVQHPPFLGILLTSSCLACSLAKSAATAPLARNGSSTT